MLKKQSLILIIYYVITKRRPTLQNTIKELKENIIECLDLEDMELDDIIDEEPLFVEGLGLDSVDALQIVVMVEEVFGVKIDNADEAKKILFSVKSIAQYIVEKKN